MIQKQSATILCKIILIIVFSMFVYSFTIINFLAFPKFCTSDMYADTAYAMLAWASKSIFPTTWVFGNQYYTIATPVLCSLIYGMTGNVNFSMALATSVMTALIILSMLFLIRPFTDRIGRLTGITAILGCMTTANAAISLEGQLFFIMASFYSCYLITLLIVIGDYLHSICFENKRGVSAALILSVFLCFATGMQSLRMTAILILPLLIAECLRILYLIKINEKEKIGSSWMVTLRVLIYAISNLFGAIYIKILNIPNVTIYGSLDPRKSLSLDEVIEINLRVFKKITGFYYAFTEENGLIYLVLASFFSGIVLFAAYISIKRVITERKTGRNGNHHLLGVFSLIIFSICMVELFFINFIIDVNLRTPYLFVWYPFVAISCVVLIQHLKPGLWKTAGVILLCLGFIGNWYTGFSSSVKKAIEPYDANIYKEISHFVVEKGYSYIYGDLYATCPIAAYANGKLIAASSCKNTLEILNYINPQGVYGQKENSRAVYIFYGDQIIEAKEYAEEIGAKLSLIAEFDDGFYSLYTSDKQLMHYSKGAT